VSGELEEKREKSPPRAFREAVVDDPRKPEGRELLAIDPSTVLFSGTLGCFLSCPRRKIFQKAID
jgi:hypothetical protein